VTEKELADKLFSGKEELKLTAKAIGAGILGLMKDIAKDTVKETEHQIGRGAHELATACLKGHDGYVLYPRASREGFDHGLGNKGLEVHKPHQGLSM
jgi:hypothetical protein